MQNCIILPVPLIWQISGITKQAAAWQMVWMPFIVSESQICWLEDNLLMLQSAIHWPWHPSWYHKVCSPTSIWIVFKAVFHKEKEKGRMDWEKTWDQRCTTHCAWLWRFYPPSCVSAHTELTGPEFTDPEAPFVLSAQHWSPFPLWLHV